MSAPLTKGEVRAALESCEDYFDQRADVDHQGDPMRPVPNAEMRRLSEVRAALAALAALEAERDALKAKVAAAYRRGLEDAANVARAVAEQYGSGSGQWAACVSIEQRLLSKLGEDA